MIPIENRSVSTGHVYSSSIRPKSNNFCGRSLSLNVLFRSTPSNYSSIRFEDQIQAEVNYNLPVKTSYGSQKYVQSVDKAKSREIKIRALRNKWFPVNDKRSIEQLLDAVKTLKDKHLTSSNPGNPSINRVRIEKNDYEIDIIPISDPASDKIRHEIFVSFVFPDTFDHLDREKFVMLGGYKTLRYSWLISKRSKRIVRAVTDYEPNPVRQLLDAETLPSTIRERKETAENESFFMNYFNNHPGFVKSYKSIDIPESKNILYMKYYQNNLLDFLDSRVDHPLDDYRKFQIAIDLLTPIATMHENGIVHRDIKPDNFLIDKHGKISITDYGFTCEVCSHSINTPKGTLTYMPYERLILFYHPSIFDSCPLSDEEHYAADIWSVGHIFLFLFYGYMPPYVNLFDLPNSASRSQVLGADTISEEILEKARIGMQTYFNNEPPVGNLTCHLIWEMLHMTPSLRPSASEVLERLKEIQKYYRMDKPSYTIKNTFVNPYRQAYFLNSNINH